MIRLNEKILGNVAHFNAVILLRGLESLFLMRFYCVMDQEINFWRSRYLINKDTTKHGL